MMVDTYKRDPGNLGPVMCVECTIALSVVMPILSRKLRCRLCENVVIQS